MGIDVDVIFKIAGVGIIVAFLVTILRSSGKKGVFPMGSLNWLYLYTFSSSYYSK